MPQLDFLSFPNQAVFLILVLTFLLFLLYIVILPDLLLIVKTNNELLKLNENNTSNTTQFSSLSALPDTSSLPPSFSSKATLPNSTTLTLQQKIQLEENQAFLYALTKTNLHFFLPFFAFLRPFDTFLLTLSFAAFFFLIYNYVSVKYINPALQQSLYKQEALFLDLLLVTHQNYTLQLQLLHKESTLAETCQHLATSQIGSLFHLKLQNDLTFSKQGFILSNSLPSTNFKDSTLSSHFLPFFLPSLKDIHTFPKSLLADKFTNFFLFSLKNQLKRSFLKHRLTPTSTLQNTSNLFHTQRILTTFSLTIHKKNLSSTF